MELLLFIRNRGEHTNLGASLGEAPEVVELGDASHDKETVTSMVDFHLTEGGSECREELRSAVSELFGRKVPQHGALLECIRPKSRLRAVLEPGFDTAAAVEDHLAQVLCMLTPSRVSYLPANTSIEPTPAA